MASSLNGLTVGDTMSDNFLDSPARDEMHGNTPHCQKTQMAQGTQTMDPLNLKAYPQVQSPLVGTRSNSMPLLLALVSVLHHPCSQSPQRGSDSDGRFPSSPSDICHSADLRRAALLRSVQIRTQCPGASSSFEQPYGPEPEPPVPSAEAEERPFSLMKEEMVQECNSSTSDFETIASKEKSCRASNMNIKDGDEAAD